MKRNFDFVISEDNGFSKIVLRFYPKKSRVFSFDESVPKSWDEVYKTYTSYSILRYNTCKLDIIPTSSTPDVLFSFSIDEGDSLLDLRQALYSIIQGSQKTNYDIYTLTFGVDWEIRTLPKENGMYKFTMINNLTGQAFRFELSKEKLIEFYNVLDSYLEYILKYRMGS